MTQGAEAGACLAHPRTMDRVVSIVLFVAAMLSLGGAVLLLLNDFIEYLQIGRWRIDSLLDIGYELDLLNSRWFLGSTAGSAMREVLRQVPTFAALLVIAPVTWWLGNRLGGR